MSDNNFLGHVKQSDSLRTQISGRYSPDNLRIFEFKRQLVEAGIDVAFPAGDEIIEHKVGFAVTVPHEARTPFHVTELKFLREIRQNPLQVTYNIYGEHDGYVGESTGLETAYALLHNKPTVLLREPESYSPSIQPEVRRIIDKYANKTTIEAIDLLARDELAIRLRKVSSVDVNYNLGSSEIEAIHLCADALTRKYMRDWQEYQRLKLMDRTRRFTASPYWHRLAARK